MEKTGDFEFNYQISDKDFYQFNKWYIHKNSISLILFLVALFLMNTVFEFRKINSSNFSGMLLHTAFFSALILISVMMLFFITKIRSARMYRADRSLHNKVKLIINNEGIEEINNSSNMKVKWENLTNIVIRKKYIYFMLTKAYGMILPVDQLVDSEVKKMIYTKKSEIRFADKSKPTVIDSIIAVIKKY